MKTIYFVRHGQSEANAAHITAGGALDVSLTDFGRKQAVEVGEMLRKKGIELIVSSPMKRSLETAQIIAAKIGYKPENIVLDSRFVERNLGVMSGKPHDEVQLWFSMGQTPAGGESSQAMYDRVAAGMAWLQSQPTDKILLVSHGGPGRVIRAIIREEPHYSIDSLGSIGNAQVLELHL